LLEGRCAIEDDSTVDRVGYHGCGRAKTGLAAKLQLFARPLMGEAEVTKGPRASPEVTSTVGFA